MSQRRLIKYMKERIYELEHRIDKLHMNRRILFDIIEIMEQDSQAKQLELEIKNTRLQKENCRYAKIIMERNVRLLQLEELVKFQANK